MTVKGSVCGERMRSIRYNMHEHVRFSCNYILGSNLLSKIFKRMKRFIAFALIFTHVHVHGHWPLSCGCSTGLSG